MSGADWRTPWSWHDELYPYALDALSPQRRKAVEDWLEAAEPARAQEFLALVARIREILAVMTVSDVVPPPPQLESVLLRALERQGPHKQPRERLHLPSAGWYQHWLTVAAAAIIAVGSGVEISAVIERVGENSGTVTVQQVLHQPDTRESSVAVTGGGTMAVYQSPALGAAAVALREMPALPADRAFQLWLAPSGGRPRSVAVIDDPRTVVTVIEATDTLAVTIEPTGGSPQPTTPIIVSMTVG
ncbi:anti-sigma factor [Nocardia asteroides]